MHAFFSYIHISCSHVVFVFCLLSLLFENYKLEINLCNTLYIYIYIYILFLCQKAFPFKFSKCIKCPSLSWVKPGLEVKLKAIPSYLR